MPNSRPRTVACPHCGAHSEWSPANPWRPFCSQRCRTIDLGQWATEAYRIPTSQPEPGPSPNSDSEA